MGSTLGDAPQLRVQITARQPRARRVDRDHDTRGVAVSGNREAGPLLQMPSYTAHLTSALLYTAYALLLLYAYVQIALQ